MSRPPNADGHRTRQAILDAALDLFAEKGFFGTSVRDVATAVGVRESALYNYFPGKEALFDALIASSHEEKTGRLAVIAAAPLGDGRAILEQLAVALLENYDSPREQQMFRLLLSDGVRLARQGRLNLLERMSSAGRGPIHELLRRLTAHGTLRKGDLTTMVVAFISPLILWRHIRAMNVDVPMVRDRNRFAAQHVEQFLRGSAADVRTAGTTGSPRPRRTPAASRRPAGRRARLS